MPKHIWHGTVGYGFEVINSAEEPSFNADADNLPASLLGALPYYL
jgi:hypothetical protein